MGGSFRSPSNWHGLADKLGYTCYWLSEHHTYTLAMAAPEVFIARLAGETIISALVSGGIMLPNHSALKAENFRLLEALYPNRIDLIGRAPVEIVFQPNYSILPILSIREYIWQIRTRKTS